MRIWIDLDGTLAYTNVGVLLRLYTSYFRLQIGDEELAQLRSVEEFEALPEVVAYREGISEVRYQYQLQAISFDPRHIRQLKTFSGAVEGVQRLSTAGEVSYCTVRRGMSEQWTRDVHQATYTWLQEHTFANADQVRFCSEPRCKLQCIATALREQPGPVVLIDDLYRTLLDEYSHLEQDDQVLLQSYLTLGAFHAKKGEEFSDFALRVLPLERWKYVDDFVQML